MSTYQRPQHLRRALLSIAMQREVDGKMEVIVTDDGSADETPEVVRAYAQSVDFPVRFTTHPHAAFQLARCRNEGVAASEAPYLLFLDGDCVLPADHVAIHLAQRRPGHVMAGHFARLDQTMSARLDEQVIRSGEFVHWVPRQELRRLRCHGTQSSISSMARGIRRNRRCPATMLESGDLIIRLSDMRACRQLEFPLRTRRAV